ncbi:Bleomycin hydrolase [Wickerhamomyces ciferrii]|uniref:Cysteine proteinase 1, mitochondrial n=1 Tax=Wickerhamomyces ciferrii (strain ATCC 14091 / BCRC 22168 / CBS 111 / JCM 3599 / NBRC 0793 / NRRL Y-1031 F-60-10) TaxID=1206466 RepID=K0KT46_WICCF|nr:Bleomycin hydrolase [Wickerhamomyces ciferrii]CCH44544.1 Bleomycin hydrolase [Wickerhamomyces ciferrii]
MLYRSTISTRLVKRYKYTQLSQLSTIQSIHSIHSSSKMSLQINELQSWQSQLDNDPQYKLAYSTLQQFNVDDALINSQHKIPNVFTHVIDVEGSPITNQKSSGRCWLFAALNILRIQGIKNLNLKELQLSQNYLFFYDKLEKSNYFLDKIIETSGEDVNSRLIQEFLTSPTNDGGQFTMFLNLIEKYGIVPQDQYPDVYSSTASRKLNELITTKLREFAEILRDLKNKGENESKIQEIKSNQIKEIYKYLTIFLGTPPSTSTEFTWEYYDKDKKYQSLTTTPLKFLQDYIKFDFSKPVSIINDPRHDYNTKIKINHLNNVSGSTRDVEYLNLDNKTLSNLIINRIKQNKPVFFGSHTPKFMNKKKGIMDIDLFQYELIGFNKNQSKKSRVIYHESLMTHAMLITGVSLNSQGEPTRYRVENSWGKDSGIDGYYIMTQDYFEQYCYQIVVDFDEISQEQQSLLKKDPIVLPLWDPMGALALCGRE